MKILYNSVHSVLEYDEVKLLAELGHDVFSLGAYSNAGRGHYLLPRPEIKGLKEYPEYERVGREYPRNNLPKEFFDNFDVIISMHMPEFVVDNWEKIKDKKVIFRSIGQNTTNVENTLRKVRYEGMRIVRMSPMEKNIIGYLGEDTMIRFYKDPEDWKDWNGKTKRAINMTQSLKGRRVFCHYDHIMMMMEGFPALIYGSGNEDLGPLNGGELPYELQKGALRDSRAFVFGGTWPSPYTLSFEEAMMTGTPMVCIGPKLAEDMPEIAQNDRYHFYEIPDVIRNGQNGFFSDSINELRDDIHQLLEDENLAKRISDEGRKTAIKFFGKNEIKEQWRKYLDSL